jgi:uncharacterized membrane protein
MKRTAILVALVLFLLAGTALASGTYELLWYSISGGGSPSGGGHYALSATVGQPAADSMSGGQYSLSGGFWSGVPPRFPVYLPIVFR